MGLAALSNGHLTNFQLEAQVLSGVLKSLIICSVVGLSSFKFS